MRPTFHRLAILTLLTVCMLLGAISIPPEVRAADFQRTKIAVLDFELIGDKLATTGMGAILSEWFTTSIVKSGRFDVVERAMLQKLLSEQKLASTGIIDDTSASKLGRILGVKVIITGSVLRLGNSIEINSRVISVESGSIIAAENIRGNTGEDMHNLVDRLTIKIMRNFPLTGYLVKRNPKTAIIDLGMESGLQPGTEFIVYREGEVIKHPKTGELLDLEQIPTGRLRITRISRNVAEGDIISEEPEGIAYGQMVKSVQVSQLSKAAPKPKQKPKPQIIEAQVLPPSPPASITLSTGKQKVKMDVAEVVPEKITPSPRPVPPPPAPPAEPKEYKVGLFPWVFYREGGTYKGILAERIKRRIDDIPRLTLTHSAYYIKGARDLKLSSSPGSLWQSSYSSVNTIQSQAEKVGIRLAQGEGINLDLLQQKGKQYGLNLAIIGKFNLVCRWSDNCQVRNMTLSIVDIANGRVYTETGSSWDEDARDYVDRVINRVFKEFMAEHNM